MSARMLIIDPEKCTGCRQCEIVCSLIHTGISNPSRSPIRVIKRENENFYIPVNCQHCVDAPCIEVCPKEAITRDDTLNRVVINRGLCVSCRMCVSVCPFGAVDFDAVKQTIIKCDLCAGDPQCIYLCESKALTYMEDYKVKHQQHRQAASRLVSAMKK